MQIVPLVSIQTSEYAVCHSECNSRERGREKVREKKISLANCIILFDIVSLLLGEGEDDGEGQRLRESERERKRFLQHTVVSSLLLPLFY